MPICHEHNLRAAPPPVRSFGIRVGLRPGDPFAKLVAPDWHRIHWFASERERDSALADMAGCHLYSRRGDEPAAVFEKIERLADAAAS